MTSRNSPKRSRVPTGNVVRFIGGSGSICLVDADRVIADDVFGNHAGFDQFDVTVAEPDGAGRERTTFENYSVLEVAVAFDLQGCLFIE